MSDSLKKTIENLKKKQSRSSDRGETWTGHAPKTIESKKHKKKYQKREKRREIEEGT